MSAKRTGLALVLLIGLTGVDGMAKAKDAKEKKKAAEQENTIQACSDEVDNDGDQHVDCDDQDCTVYAICVPAPVAEPLVTEQPAVAVYEDEHSAETAPDRGKGETGELCSDKLDNDEDGLVDCADDSCGRVSWCRTTSEVRERCHDNVDNDNDGLVDCQEPSCKTDRHCVVQPEEGYRRCSDKIDNDKNGKTDCEEKSCFDEWVCRRHRYYVPEPANKPVGLLLNLGGGVALPNWDTPTATTDPKAPTRYGTTIPYSPDIGLAVNVAGAYLPLNWLGFGIKLMLLATYGTNDDPWYVEDDPFVYQAWKRATNASGYVRFQYPFGRFVPHLDVAIGYSYAEYTWRVRPDWHDHIYDADDWDDYPGPEDRYGAIFRHMTVAVEPGFDFFLRARSVALGIRAWLPVIASHDRKTDNIVILMNVTFTPQWRERPVLKPEYREKPE